MKVIADIILLTNKPVVNKYLNMSSYSSNNRYECKVVVVVSGMMLSQLHVSQQSTQPQLHTLTTGRHENFTQNLTRVNVQ